MIEPLAISMFLPSLEGGGAERVFVNLAGAFAARGHRIELLLLHARGPHLSSCATDGIEIHELGSDPLRLLTRLHSHWQHGRPDVILSGLNAPNLAALLVRPWVRPAPRLVLTQHAHFSSDTTRSATTRKRAVEFASRHLFRFADHVVCVSQGVADDLIDNFRLSSERVSTIPNAFDLRAIRSLARAQVEHPWLARRDYLVSMGRLTQQKDFPTLLGAFAQLRRTHSEIGLAILGEGPDRDELEALVRRLDLQGHVRFEGYQTNPYPLMAGAKAFVLSSAWEGFGNVLVEALSLGKPCVATDCPSGPAEILGNGRWGRLVPVGDAKALGAALADVLDAPGPPEELQRRADDFSVDQLAERYLQVLAPL